MIARMVPAAIALAAASCAGNDALVLVTPELPAEVRWGAIVLLDGRGAAIAGTPLLRREGDAPFEGDLSAFEGRAAEARFAGYTDAALAALSIPGDAERAGAAVSIAGDADPILPAPSFGARGTVSGGRAELRPASDAGAFTVGWLPPCPTLSATAARAIAISCAAITPTHCSGSIEQIGCKVGIDTGSCRNGRLDVTLDGRGRVRVATADKLGACTAADPAPGASFSLSCAPPGAQSCTIDAYVLPAGGPFEVAGVDVVRAAPLAKTDIREKRGYVWGPAILGSRAFVASIDGKDYEHDCDTSTASRVPARSSLHAYDLETLARVSTATAPSCLGPIAPSSVGFELLAIHGGRDPHLARLDPGGRVLRQVRVEDPSFGSAYVVAAMAVSPAGWVALVVKTVEEPGVVPDKVAFYDALTLQRISLSRFLGEGVRTIAVSSRDRLLVGEDDQDVLFELRALDAQPVRQTFFTALRGGVNTDFVALMHHPPSQRDLIAAHGVDPAIYTITRSEPAVLGSTAYFEAYASPDALAPWAPDPDLVLSALLTPDQERKTSVALLDPATPRFLPGSARIGNGPVGGIEVDARGRVWLSLPWTGRLVRVTPRM